MKLSALYSGLTALLFALSACSGGKSPSPSPPPEVTVANPLVRDVVDWDDFVGRFEAVEDVEVKPRVSGYLVGVHFRDGQYVRQGQLLFTIDARPTQALLDQARAQLARAEAQLINARTEYARSKTLAAQKAASVEELEQRQAALRSPRRMWRRPALPFALASSTPASRGSLRRFPAKSPSVGSRAAMR